LNDLTPYRESALTEYIEVTLVLNPLAQGDRLVVRVSPSGTLAELIEALVPNELDRDHISAFLGGDYIEPQLWSKIRPKSGSSVFLRLVPQDPVTIISILASAAAPTIAGAVLGAGASAFALALGPRSRSRSPTPHQLYSGRAKAKTAPRARPMRSPQRAIILRRSRRSRSCLARIKWSRLMARRLTPRSQPITNICASS
jgi:hypothetical protein